MAGHLESDAGMDEVQTYEAPAIESRTSARDPLVWIAPASPVVC